MTVHELLFLLDNNPTLLTRPPYKIGAKKKSKREQKRTKENNRKWLSADYRADLDRNSFDGEVVATAVAVYAASPKTLVTKYSSSSTTDAATTVIGGGGAATAEAAPAAAVKPRLRRATTPPNITPRGKGRPALTFDEKLPKDQKEFLKEITTIHSTLAKRFENEGLFDAMVEEIQDKMASKEGADIVVSLRSLYDAKLQYVIYLLF